MHDWWCALVVSALGKVTYDPGAHVLYRQHGRNYVGAEVGALATMTKKAMLAPRNLSRLYPIHAQASELVRLFGARLAPLRLALAEGLVSSKRSMGARISYALAGPLLRSRPLESLAARGLIMAGLY
jgi:hypothetical protein